MCFKAFTTDESECVESMSYFGCVKNTIDFNLHKSIFHQEHWNLPGLLFVYKPHLALTPVFRIHCCNSTEERYKPRAVWTSLLVKFTFPFSYKAISSLCSFPFPFLRRQPISPFYPYIEGIHRILWICYRYRWCLPGTSPFELSTVVPL